MTIQPDAGGLAPEFEDEETRIANNIMKMEECERQLKELFEKFPEKYTKYDEDCMDLCIPEAEAIS